MEKEDSFQKMQTGNECISVVCPKGLDPRRPTSLAAIDSLGAFCNDARFAVKIEFGNPE